MVVNVITKQGLATLSKMLSGGEQSSVSIKLEQPSIDRPLPSMSATCSFYPYGRCSSSLTSTQHWSVVCQLVVGNYHAELVINHLGGWLAMREASVAPFDRAEMQMTVLTDLCGQMMHECRVRMQRRVSGEKQGTRSRK